MWILISDLYFIIISEEHVFLYLLCYQWVPTEWHNNAFDKLTCMKGIGMDQAWTEANMTKNNTCSGNKNGYKLACDCHLFYIWNVLFLTTLYCLVSLRHIALLLLFDVSNFLSLTNTSSFSFQKLWIALGLGTKFGMGNWFVLWMDGSINCITQN